MNDSISEAIKEIWKGEDAQNILKMISINIWARIEFARNRKGLKIFETTVTQEILHFIMFAASNSHFDIKLFEAKSENANGNDIECFIETEKGFILLPMQAKIIYEDFKYPQIDHQVGKDEQIDLLIEYARKKKGYPLYLLYNYHNDESLLEKIEFETKIHHRLYGISYLDALHLKENYFQKRINRKGEKTWLIPSFKDLHPKMAKPFYKILDKHGLSSDGFNFIRQNLAVRNSNLNLKMYTRDEIVEDEDWNDLTPSPGIGKLPSEMQDANFLKRDFVFDKNEFNPKFRMMLSSKIFRTQTRIIE